MSRKSSKYNSRVLAELVVGEESILQSPSRQDGNVLRLVELGMTEGESVQLIRKGPFGDPIQVAVRGARLCLRRADAELFPVE